MRSSLKLASPIAPVGKARKSRPVPTSDATTFATSKTCMKKTISMCVECREMKANKNDEKKPSMITSYKKATQNVSKATHRRSSRIFHIRSNSSNSPNEKTPPKQKVYLPSVIREF